ncbi:MAG: hypothetical protein IJZ23_07010 [Roseburia sp.]|nr:hypothetical protein [Roseburia sp.]MBQ8279575.1 hypothetical protein [Roseburia sp.]
MDKKEFSMLAMAIRTYYPKENILPNQQAMELWYRELQDIPYNVAEASLRQWVATNKWSPSIAEIREMASSVQHGSIPDWGDGWEQVLKAIRKYGSYRIPEAMESFDPITRQCVERLGFRNICMSENINHDRANFRMIYEQLQERKKKEGQMSLPLKQIILAIQGEQSERNLIEGGKE